MWPWTSNFKHNLFEAIFLSFRNAGKVLHTEHPDVVDP